MMEQKPVAHLWNDFGKLKVSQIEPHEDYAFPVFTAEQLKAEREKAIADYKVESEQEIKLAIADDLARLCKTIVADKKLTTSTLENLESLANAYFY